VFSNEKMHFSTSLTDAADSKKLVAKKPKRSVLKRENNSGARHHGKSL
jgi:hypothetical protein